MNARLLRSTVRVMCSKKLVTMDQWAAKGPCGTVGCIAGTRALLDQKRSPKLENYPPTFMDGAYNNSWVRHAAKRFKLDPYQAHRLFYVSAWPYELRKRYTDAKRNKQRASVVKAAVEDFIKTKGWPDGEPC